MNIILIGFMGSGKTTIGTALAQRTNLKFIDTDVVIEEQQGIPIKDIFSRHGEAHFRQLEKEAIEQLVSLDNYIIAVGGGAVMYHNNFETLKKIGVTVFLDAPIQKILTNLQGKFRPLIGNAIDEAKITQLLSSRYATYKKADIVVNTENHDIQQTVDAIAAKLGL